MQTIDYAETLILSGQYEELFTVLGKIKHHIREYVEDFVPKLVKQGAIKDLRTITNKA